MSSLLQGIVALSLLFEVLLQTHEPELFFHLKSVGCQPYVYTYAVHVLLIPFFFLFLNNCSNIFESYENY